MPPCHCEGRNGERERSVAGAGGETRQSIRRPDNHVGALLLISTLSSALRFAHQSLHVIARTATAAASAAWRVTGSGTKQSRPSKIVDRTGSSAPASGSLRPHLRLAMTTAKKLLLPVDIPQLYWPVAAVRGCRLAASLMATLCLCAQMSPALAQSSTPSAASSFAGPMPVGSLSAQTLLQQSFQYDPNPLLNITGAKAVAGSITSPQLILNADLPARHADLDNRVDINQYDLAGFSSTDLHSKGHFTANGETWQTTLAATLDHDTTRNSEATASGINIAGIGHTAIAFNPQATVNLTPLDLAQLGMTYQRNLYDSTRQYTNYETIGFTPSWQHSFGPLDAAQILLQVGRYQTRSGPSITIDNIGPAFGWTRRFSERISVSANVGGQEMMFRYGPGIALKATSTFGYTFGVTAGFQGQQDTIQLNANRQPSPNANGSESQTTTISINEVHMVTTRLEADLTASYQMFDYSGGLATSQSGLQNAYASLAPKILYHLTDSLTVDLTYQFRQKDIVSGQTAQTNAILLNLNYKPLARVLGW